MSYINDPDGLAERDMEAEAARAEDFARPTEPNSYLDLVEPEIVEPADLPDVWHGEQPIPVLGLLVDLSNARDCAVALDAIRGAEEQLAEAKRVVVDQLIAERRYRGEGTWRYDDGVTVEVPKPEETVYDADEIERELRDAGMPEERIAEIVRETVSRKVMAGEAKKAAAANPEYAAIIERHARKVEKRPSPKVSVPRSS